MAQGKRRAYVSAWVCLVFWLVCTLTLGVTAYLVGYSFDRDAGAYLMLTDDASVAPAKLAYLEQYREAVHTIVTGDNARLVWSTPQTSVANQFFVLDTLVERVTQVAQMDPASFEYQQAMLQITGQEFAGSIETTNGLLRDAYIRRHGWLGYLHGVGVIAITVGVVGLLGVVVMFFRADAWSDY